MRNYTRGEFLRLGALIAGAFSIRKTGLAREGKLADFVILERDPHDVPPDTIKDIRVVRTVAGGRTTYEG